MRAPANWAYQRQSELLEQFRGNNAPADLRSVYADLRGAFARYIEQHEKPPRN